MADLIAEAAKFLQDRYETLVRSGDRTVVNAYRQSQVELVRVLRDTFDRYFPKGEVSFAAARRKGVEAYLKQAVERAMQDLELRLSGDVTEQVVNMMTQTAKDSLTALRKLKVPVIVPSSLTLEEIRQRALEEWGGAALSDRMFHMTEKLKGEIATDLRSGLLQQQSYEQFRDKLMRRFGSAKLNKPAFSAYGSVKVWRNEARRAWAGAMQDVYENNAEGLLLVWRSALRPTTDRGCAGRHGKTIVQLGGVLPPAHVNCLCDVVYIPQVQWTAYRATMIAERQTWIATFGSLKRAA